MTKPKHVPECFNGRQRSGGLPCICDRLRACEQRVLNTVEQAVLAKVHQNPATPVQIAENSGLGMAWSVIDELLREGEK